MDTSNRKIIDISPVINNNIAVFPGDTKFQRDELLSFENGHNLVLSSVKTTVHLGAHTDAPSHYHPEGKTIEKVDLNTYIGPCQVIEIKNQAPRLKIEDLEINGEIQCERVLVKTNSFPNPYLWNNDFCAFSPELIEYFAKKGVKLIGIDTPSVDPADDKELLSHNTIYKNNMAILEGIVLTNVKPGLYELLALPLPIEGCDASPVRAVLIEK